MNELPWWTRYNLEFPVRSKKLKDIATIDPDGVWRMDDTHAVTEETIQKAASED